eukprot:5467440-Pyramimonas_sp.AAC.1
MAPSCRGTGPPSGLYCRIYRETWRTRYTDNASRISSCGQFALVQMHRGRLFFVEQLSPTWP